MLNRNDESEAKKMMLLCMAAASVVVLLFLLALYFHDKKTDKKLPVKEEITEEETEPEIEVGRSNIVSEDLDFWDLYSNGEKKPIEDIDDDEKSLDNAGSDEVERREIVSSLQKKDDPLETEEPETDKESVQKEEMNDGKHIKVEGPDGKAAWYDILDSVNKNTFDFSEYLTYDNGFLKYNSPSVKSYIGVDISSSQGTIDFEKVKKAGIDFVMLKGASRGYETGQITIDDKFVEYAQGALAFGLPIGVVFSSQAVNEMEAVEEANFIVAAAYNITAKYPIAMDLSEVKNDKARTDKLTSKERTALVKKFCETVKAYGKTPIIRASRDFLITELNLSELKDYDIWLKDEAVTADYMRSRHVEDNDIVDTSEDNSSDSKEKKKNPVAGTDNNADERVQAAEEEDRPDYIGTDFPYEFEMWQYTEMGTVNGINSSVNLDISFVNYAEK